MAEQSKTGFRSFAVESWLITAVAIALAVLAGLVTVPFWGVVMAWFGFIYLVAFTVGALILVILPTKVQYVHPRRRLRLRRIGGLAAAGVIAVVLTVIYATISGASGSGMSLSQVVGIQLFHSAICFIFSILTAAVWQIIQARKAARLAGP